VNDDARVTLVAGSPGQVGLECRAPGVKVGAGGQDLTG
jgi:hypothetical protein